jgi:hypothetical protein
VAAKAGREEKRRRREQEAEGTITLRCLCKNFLPWFRKKEEVARAGKQIGEIENRYKRYRLNWGEGKPDFNLPPWISTIN